VNKIKCKQLVVRIDRDLWMSVARESLNSDRSIKDVVIEALTIYLNKKGKQ